MSRKIVDIFDENEVLRARIAELEAWADSQESLPQHLWSDKRRLAEANRQDAELCRFNDREQVKGEQEAGEKR